MMNETRERFLRGILERVSPERIVEIHFFPPIRQGQIESGVAVVAVESIPVTVDSPALEAIADELAAAAVATLDEPEPPVFAVATLEEPEPPVFAVASRLEVCTAAYRWTRKGPERGKWELDFKTQGDAPLPAVGTVVRGVEQRSGDDLGAMCLDADTLRALLDTPAWRTSTP
jgi:hypothetical protein